MSRDPLEELFGPLDGDDVDTGAIETGSPAGAGDPNDGTPTRAFEPAKTQPNPGVVPPPQRAPAGPVQAATPPARPAPERTAAPMQAPRGPQTARSGAASGRIPGDGLAGGAGATARKKSHVALPWIIVAVVAVLALVAALLVVNSAKGDEPQPETTTEAPKPTPTTSGGDNESEEPRPEKPAEPKVPKVDVGPNPISMDISFAGISVESSQKLTNPQWFYHAGPPERVMFESGLMNSFPDSCAAMRSPVGKSPWGIEKGEGDTWSVVRPEGTCEADTELYDEVWGLMQAVADSAKPL